MEQETGICELLRAARERMSDGSYGRCLECFTAITPARLRSLPWAKLCMACQEAADEAAESPPAKSSPFSLGARETERK
jgi:DnaK suppressor protein